MRKLVIGLVATVTTAVTGAVAADFGAAIYAEFHWARSVRAANQLAFDPWVSILGFPFATQAADHRYREVEFRAGVGHPVVDRVSIEATMHSVDLTDTSWLISPTARLTVGKLESRIIIDSMHVGRYLGIKDLMIEAPPKETNDATGGTTESGISENRGLVFTGTPTAAGLEDRVSVSVDLSTPPGDDTTLVFTATDVLTGAGTADRAVTDEKKAAVLAAFGTTMPGMTLPFDIAPTREGARGSDIVIEGIASGVTVDLNRFKES